jgi:haloalkane dehalogenase
VGGRRVVPVREPLRRIDGHTIHYVDEGSGPTLLFLHGNPTWSFVYRDVIRALRDEFRCVALDYPAFGLSSAEPAYRYLPEEHTQVVTAFVDALALSGVTLVAHDWGGPIGLAAVEQRPTAFDRLVLANTWAWPIGAPHVQILSHLMGGPLGRLLIRQFNLFVNAMIPAGHRLRKPTDEEMAHYQKGPRQPRTAQRVGHLSPAHHRQPRLSRRCRIQTSQPRVAADPHRLGRRRRRLRERRAAAMGADLHRPSHRDRRRRRPFRPI